MTVTQDLGCPWCGGAIEAGQYVTIIKRRTWHASCRYDQQRSEQESQPEGVSL